MDVQVYKDKLHLSKVRPHHTLTHELFNSKKLLSKYENVNSRAVEA